MKQQQMKTVSYSREKRSGSKTSSKNSSSTGSPYVRFG